MWYTPSPYGQMLNQPMQQYQQPQQQQGFSPQQSNLIKVTGAEGAKAYQMQPNSAAILLDDSSDIFFLKTTDGANFPTTRAFKFAEIKSEQSEKSEYVTRQEFNKLKERLDNGEQYISESKSSQHKKSNANNEAV